MAPTSSNASWWAARESAVHQSRGSCSLTGGVVRGCGAEATPPTRPSSASRSTMVQDWVDESTPATRVISVAAVAGGIIGRGALADGATRVRVKYGVPAVAAPLHQGHRQSVAPGRDDQRRT